MRKHTMPFLLIAFFALESKCKSTKNISYGKKNRDLFTCRQQDGCYKMQPCNLNTPYKGALFFGCSSVVLQYFVSHPLKKH